MTAPIAGVNYRIQNVDLQTYLEVLDSTNIDYLLDNASLRPMKVAERQYWTFETVPNYSSYFYVRNVANTNQCFGLYTATSTYTGRVDTTCGLVNITQLSVGIYQLSFYCNATNYYWYPDPNNNTTVTLGTVTTTSNLESQKWKLVPVTPQPVKINYPLEKGVYRMRNLNGRSFLTFDNNDNSVFIKSQFDQSTYQLWNVIIQPSTGTYIIQDADTNLYLGCSSTVPSSGDALVGMTTAFEWDLQSIGGFAWTIRIPNDTLSIGFEDYEVDDESEPSLVPSDATPSQMWYMENSKFIPTGKDKIHATREFDEGKYLLQSCHDQTIYMNVFSTPYRITSGTATTSQFQLKYIDTTSPIFTLTYVTKSSPPPLIADAGDYVSLTKKGTKFVLLKKAEDQYVICCSSVSEYPRKVVSARQITDVDNNPVFATEDETGETLQNWKLISVT